MTSEVGTGRRGAWQPLTLRGVAAFAQASLARLLLVQMVAAAVGGASVATCLTLGWMPALQEALQRLPEQTSFRAGTLAWTSPSPQVLGRRPMLALLVDVDDANRSGQLADVQIEWGRREVKLRSLLGYLSLPYPDSWSLTVDRIQWESWWGAWRPVVMVGLAVSTGGLLLLGWWLLAAIYLLPARISAWVLRRDANRRACWKLAGAALLPGALWMSGALLLYALNQLSLVGLLFAFGIHWFIGWFYLLLAITCLPPRPTSAAPADNPFAARPEPPPTESQTDETP